MRGRKTKYTEEVVKEICEHLRQGRTQKDAAILSGIGESTLYLWMNDKDKLDFVERIKKAESEFKRQLEIRMQKAADETWQAAAWMLERRFKQDYAQRYEQTGDKGERLIPRRPKWFGDADKAAKGDES